MRNKTGILFVLGDACGLAAGCAANMKTTATAPVRESWSRIEIGSLERFVIFDNGHRISLHIGAGSNSVRVGLLKRISAYSKLNGPLSSERLSKGVRASCFAFASCSDCKRIVTLIF